MKAVEFHTIARDGVITLPNQYGDWEGKNIRVILLEEEQEGAPVASKEYHQFKALRLNTHGFHFDREKANER